MSDAMYDYNGVERQIRVTNRGGYQVLPVSYSQPDMTRAPVFATREEAEAYIRRPMPLPEMAERDREAERTQYRAAYAAILQAPDLRAMRGEIQEQHSAAAHLGKLAGDHQRAALMGAGQISCMGRDIGAVRQSYADTLADEAQEESNHYRRLTDAYERVLQDRMTEAEIPVELFRSPVLVANAIPSKSRPWYERFPECRRPHVD